MRKLLIPALLLPVISMLALGVFAQDDKPKAAGQLSSTYDSVTDTTRIELPKLPVTADNVTLSLLTVSVGYAGKTLRAKPDSVVFIISLVTAKGHRYPDQNKVTFTSGGAEIGGIIFLNLDQSTLSPTEELETVGTKMSINLFQNIAASNQAVTFKVAETNITIPLQTLTKLLGFKNAITP